RVGILIGARGPGAPGLPRSHARPGLHLLGQILGSAAHGVERAPLGIDRGVGVAVAERTLGIAHRLLGAPERALASFAGRLLPQLAALLHFVEQFPELFAQRLLVLAQPAHALLALLTLLSLLTLLALLSLLALLTLLAALAALAFAA